MTSMQEKREYQKRYRAQNPERIKEKNIEWRKNNAAYLADYERERRKHPEKSKARGAQQRKWKRESGWDRQNHLKNKYGMTLNDYDSMVAAQNGVCAICFRPNTGARKNLDVDHDHNTGKVRGLLCNGCNTGLGHFRENTETLLSAVAYLHRNAEQ